MNNVCPKEHDPTVEDSYTVIISTSTGEGRHFKILDTAGEDDYQTMIDEWIKTADGFLLLFAINDKESFEALKVKISRIKKNNKDKLPLILVGNKCDLDNKRDIDKKDAVEFAKSIGAKYYETSALTDENKNVKVVFQQCAHMIINSIHLESQSNGPCPSCIIA